MVLQNQADGHESKFIRKIVNVVTIRISRSGLYATAHLIGIEHRARHINSWMQDGSSDVGLLVVCGMGGIGKTTWPNSSTCQTFMFLKAAVVCLALEKFPSNLMA
ncbi:disease resistance protein RUN1-like [Solanum stenotomum]|uniref:disease resistance protein RUN1-like n=1 Tax=Solanum stenotomum TaxID=172797 RepID=UPI0020D15C05|nr:disease resistance protein RUN1-like [Solanum stenotomum]